MTFASILHSRQVQGFFWAGGGEGSKEAIGGGVGQVSMLAVVPLDVLHLPLVRQGSDDGSAEVCKCFAAAWGEFGRHRGSGMKDNVGLQVDAIVVEAFSCPTHFPL